MNMLKWLESFYESGYGRGLVRSYHIQIHTLGNPGWCLKIDLKNTDLENRPSLEYIIDRNDDDWMHCFVRNKLFEGYGGPNNLNELLVFFRNWVEAEY